MFPDFLCSGNLFHYLIDKIRPIIFSNWQSTLYFFHYVGA